MSAESVMTASVRRGQRQPRHRDRAGSDIAPVTLHLLCLAVTLLAGVIFTLTEHDAADHHHSAWCTAEITLQILVTLVAAIVIRRRASHTTTNNALPVLLIMTVILSLLCEPVQRLMFDEGKPFEILVMHSQSNLMLALAACGHRIAYQRLAMLIAVFLTIFCCSLSSASSLLPLAALVTLLCLAWLVFAWWTGLRNRQLIAHGNGRWRAGWLMLGIPCLLALAVGTGPNKATSALRGFMPGSGGTEFSDPHARGGVHDGEHLVAGKQNVRSFAPIEGAPFLDSDKPSLYDVFNDTFDPPPRKIKKQQRAIALPPDLLMHIHQQMADAKSAGRQFSLTRGEPQAKVERPEDLNTHALLQVAGRTPLHLRMEVYDVFDGFTWYPVAEDPRDIGRNRPMRSDDIQHWLQLNVPGRSLDIHGPAESRGVRILNLGGNTLPLPAHTSELSIERVNRPDMYRIRSASRISLAREDIPEMTTVNVMSHAVDRDSLRESDSLSLVSWSSGPSAALPTGFDDVTRLAESIVASEPRGWSQVEAISAYVRTHFELDRDYRVPEDAGSPVHHFLFESRRGPEYLFAAATASLLRSAGYATRLVSGFYVQPKKYDKQKHHTQVHARDAHFWCEVFVGTNVWITIDPSPGYVMADAPPGLWKQLASLSRQLSNWAQTNWILLLVGLTTAVVVTRHRAALLDASLSLSWRSFRSSNERRAVLALARIIRRRLQVSGVAVSDGVTLRRAADSVSDPDIADGLRELARLVDWAAYSTVRQAPVADVATLNEELTGLQSNLSLCQFRAAAADRKRRQPQARSDSPFEGGIRRSLPPRHRTTLATTS